MHKSGFDEIITVNINEDIRCIREAFKKNLNAIIYVIDLKRYLLGIVTKGDFLEKDLYHLRILRK